MTIKFVNWIKNLPWNIAEIFICDLFGHKPMPEAEFIPGVTCCSRCMATLKLSSDSTWQGKHAMIDIVPLPNVKRMNEQLHYGYNKRSRTTRK